MVLQLLRLFLSRFILVVAAPKSGRHEGYSRRVEAVDKILSRQKLVYVFVNSDRFLGQAEAYGNSLYFRLHGRNPLHHLLFAFLVLRSQAIYCHSVFGVSRKLIRLWISALRPRVVVDFHGLVPEETKSEGNTELAGALENWERWIANRAVLLIVVSQQMRAHFVRKYPELASREFLVLPVVEAGSSARTPGVESKVDRLVVYSGGVQNWQRIELMAQVIEGRPDFEYLILSPDGESFSRLFPKESYPNVKIDYAEKGSYQAAMERATFGFVLRRDEPINRVACPTKIFDYLSAGVIPIVESEDIGDFRDMGMVSIPWQEFLKGKAFTKEFLRDAVDRNRQVATSLVAQGDDAIKQLNERIRYRGC